MAAKQAASGHEWYVEFDGTEISVDMRKFDPGIDSVEVNSTAGNDGLESSHQIRYSCTPTGQFLVEKSNTAVLAVLKRGNTGNLIWGKYGNTSGQPKGGIEARLKKAEVVADFEAEQVFDCEWVNIAREFLYDDNSDTF